MTPPDDPLLLAIDDLLSVKHREDDRPCSCDECMAYVAEDAGADWYRIPPANRIAMRILDGADDRFALLVEAFRDHEAALQQPARSEETWLIERGQPEGEVTRWWTGTEYTTDANEALRFPDKVAALAYIGDDRRLGRVVEHIFLDTSYHRRRVARRKHPARSEGLDVKRLARAMHNGYEGEPCPDPDCPDIASWRRDAANLAREYAALRPSVPGEDK